MAITIALTLLLILWRVAEAAVVLALWRRWLGGLGGDFPRSVKIAALCLYLIGLIARAAGVWPWRWDWAALLIVAVGCALVCLWFLVAHNNGGAEGKDGPQRYGWAGEGYPWAWQRRDTIPEVKLLGLAVVSRGAWTEVAELWLGGVSGAFIGAAVGLNEAVLMILTVIA